MKRATFYVLACERATRRLHKLVFRAGQYHVIPMTDRGRMAPFADAASARVVADLVVAQHGRQFKVAVASSDAKLADVTRRTCGPRLRVVKRGRNPVPPSKHVKLREAGKLYQEFSGHRPTGAKTHRIRLPDVGLQVGRVDGILYSTVRDGRAEKYVHRFKRSARPLLAASHDGRTLVIVGGRYQFTDRGIIDK